MAGGLLEDRKAANGTPSPGEALFQRRIEFRPATKAFSSMGTPSGFRLETLNPSTDAHAPRGADEVERAGAGRQSDRAESNKDRLVVDPELSYKITFRRIGAGLENMGNTCFLNSVLQCLTYTEPFAAYLQSGKHKSSCRMAGFCAMCALQNHVMTALQSTGKILVPSQLVKNLRCVSRNFRYARQEDAHEYMVHLLESMHKCCLPLGVSSESPSAYEKSLVHKIFGGSLRSEVKCMQCSHVSNKVDPFLDLSLEIEKADSIHKALGHFTAFDQLDGGARAYQCPHCKQKVRAAKRLTVHKAPYVLTIHLKRFGLVLGQKIDKRVEFGPTLNMKPFVSDPQEGGAIYTLYGVLVHAGYTTRSGHYYCYVRTSSGLWYSLNDNQVTQVSEKVVLAQKAYMLFYIRNRSYAPKQTVDVARKENIFAPPNGLGLLMPSKSPTMQNGLAKNISETNTLSNNKSNSKESSQKLTFKSPSLNVNGNLLTQTGPRSVLSSGNVQEFQKCIENKNMVVDNHVKNCPTNGLSPGVDALHDTPEGHMYPCSSQCSSDCQRVSECLLASGSNVNEKVSATLRQESKINDSEGSTLEVTGNKDAVIDDKCNGHLTGDSAEVVKNALPNGSLSHSNGSVDSKHFSQKTESDLTSIKRPKLANARLVHGPRHLLLASLSLRKKKKLKKSKRKHSNGKCFFDGDMSQTGTVLTEQEASTSTAVNVLAVNGKKSVKKRSRPGSTKDHSKNQSDQDRVHRTGDLSSSNSGTKKLETNVQDPELRCTDNVAVTDTGKQKQHETCPDLNSRNGGSTDVDANHLSKNGVMNILMNGLTDAYVPKWDNIDQPQINGQLVDGQNKNIGHILDEWDEEYDRGKRKKVRRSQFVSSESNPFEEIAKRNTQEKIKKKLKLENFRSGNQPVRIF